MSTSIARSVRLESARVLVVGDLMFDRFCYGSVSRISPEAPVPVVLVSREQAMLGGSGNVLANLCAVGSTAGLIGVVGDDDAGRQCAAMVGQSGGDASLLVVDPTRPTTVKTRFISGSQQLLRCDYESVGPVGQDVERQLIDNFDRALENYDVVALSDYAKGVLTDAVLAHVITACRARNVPVIVDPKRRDFSAYAGATVIKPNRAELSHSVGMPCTDLAASEIAARAVMQQTGAAILLTLSEAGMALFRHNRDTMHLHATATEVFDVSGAGDTALAIFCAGLAVGRAMEEAAMLANAAAGAVVRKLGTATLSQAELARAVAAIDAPAVSTICSAEAAAWQVETWKHEGLRVGFTNGCFDIVHAGHIQILREARARCDRLVVGLNSDQSVARLKGPSRPVQSQDSRASVLAAIDAVDLVVIFEEDTPQRLIELLIPTDLIKGADYREDDVVGGAFVKAHGGCVHLIDLVPGLSTSAAIARIQQQELAEAESNVVSAGAA